MQHNMFVNKDIIITNFLPYFMRFFDITSPNRNPAKGFIPITKPT